MQLAVGAVVLTTLVVGMLAHLVQLNLPCGARFTPGAIVLPSDAVAAIYRGSCRCLDE